MSSKNRLKATKTQGKKLKSHAASNVSPEQQYPAFSLRYLDQKHGLEQCNQEQKAALIETIHKLSQLTWNHIYSSNRHASGCEKIAKMSIKVPIPKHIPKDANFIAFRFYGMAPMIGYRDETIFYILWLDIHFSVYSH
ncbi:hypothetical protein PN36_28430 [Candidatus Thiomargarita nelsonii]|uniref:Uncharacterized protein n=1 Tax=Candidatus Thiomargarita nelsonii TaxID=1003181 RepID=A0A0A6PKD0_9GAMM|nr:hypothetical protein PN36_28430 [Candidatus Thiomargarita nelsonii]